MPHWFVHAFTLRTEAVFQVKATEGKMRFCMFPLWFTHSLRSLCGPQGMVFLFLSALTRSIPGCSYVLLTLLRSRHRAPRTTKPCCQCGGITTLRHWHGLNGGILLPNLRIPLHWGRESAFLQPLPQSPVAIQTP